MGLESNASRFRTNAHLTGVGRRTLHWGVIVVPLADQLRASGVPREALPSTYSQRDRFIKVLSTVSITADAADAVASSLQECITQWIDH